MSLFIGGLAFTGDDFTQQVRHGVIGASVLSALLGYAVLRLSCRSLRRG
jgi:NhaA family Na+:H+ antiporter